MTAGIPTLIDNLGDSQAVTLNSAQYVTLPPPAARAPVASIALITGTLQYTGAQPITLSSNSTPGFDVIPNPMTPNQPITQYTWTLVSGSAPTGITFPASTSTISFVAPNPPTQPFSINLTVATAPNSADPNYVSVSKPVTITFSPSNPGAQLDVYITNTGPFNTTNPYKSPTGQGTYNDTVDSFAPQELMNVASYVTWNFAPVADKLVTFQVNFANGTNVATFVAYTNSNGYAYASYRLPNYNSSIMPFGNYQVTSFVDVAQNREQDSFTFQYNYIVNINAASMALNVPRNHYAALTVGLNNTSLQAQTYTITYTITDNANVPVFSGEVAGQTIPAASSQTNITVMMFVPAFSFCGPSTVHINVFNADPSNPANQALPFCPEFDQPFSITVS